MRWPGRGHRQSTYGTDIPPDVSAPSRLVSLSLDHCHPHRATRASGGRATAITDHAEYKVPAKATWIDEASQKVALGQSSMQTKGGGHVTHFCEG